MQHNIEEIRRRLLSCIDSQHNVTDMSQCLEIITLLERTPITRELLEATRLGKHINDIRRKTSHQELYRRAKDLVRRWRRMYVLQEGVNGATPSAGSVGPGSGAGPGGGSGGGVGGVGDGGGRSAGAGNGHPPTSPSSLPSSCNTSPGLSRPSTPSTIPSRPRTLSPTLTTSQSTHTNVSKSKPYSPALSGLNRGLSPTVSQSGQCSPCVSPSMANAKQRSKPQAPHSPAINKTQTVESRADASSYAMSTENVDKSNTANKRLRKADDCENSVEIPSIKRAKHSIPPSSVITNGQVDEEWSRDSFSSVLSNDNKFNQTSASSENNKNNPKRTLNSGSTPVSGKQKLHKQTPITPKQEHKSHKHDSIKQEANKMSSIKSAKVKTTSQLVQDLANRKGDQKLAERAIKLEEQQMRELTHVVPATDPEIISRNKREHMEKFLKSQPDVGFTEGDDIKSPYSSDGVGAESAPAISLPPSPSALPPPQFPVRQTVSNLDLLGVMPDETAEEILARLPPIDLDSIVWDDEPEEEQEGDKEGEKVKKKKKDHEGSVSGSDEGSDGESEVDENERLLEGASKVLPETVETLHSTNLDCQNGNFDNDGKFREWHEVYNKKAYQDELLPVLPYVITDY